MGLPKYGDIVAEIRGQIGIIRFNRPKSLNAFGGNLIPETIDAIRRLDKHADTVFTVLTGTGRFFSSGADVMTGVPKTDVFSSESEAKLAFVKGFAPALELLRSIIDHKKIFILATNGPGVGGGASWFHGVSDLVFASSDGYLAVPFSALGLVPEQGSAPIFAQSIGVHRATDFLMFGRKASVQQLEKWGMVNRVFPKEGFLESVVRFLEEMLVINDPVSMMEVKRLQNAPLRDGRIVAVVNAMDALAEVSFV